MPEVPTWYKDGNGSLHSSADDVIHGEHPVGFDVMIPQDLVHLRKTGWILRLQNSQDSKATLTDLVSHLRAGVD